MTRFIKKTGLIALLKRKCGVIICSDALLDPESNLLELRDIIEDEAISRLKILKKVESLSSDLLLTQEIQEFANPTTEMNKRYGEKGFLLFRLQYSDDTNGILIYLHSPAALKPTSLQLKSSSGCCCDCCHQWCYQGTCGHFPNHSTMNQCFTKLQFEVYEQLGRDIMETFLVENHNLWQSDKKKMKTMSGLQLIDKYLGIKKRNEITNDAAQKEEKVFGERDLEKDQQMLQTTFSGYMCKD